MALDDAVGPREVDVLEDAEPAVAPGEGQQAFDPTSADDDDLARRDIAHELGADDVESAGLRRENPGVAEPAENQRAHPERIAHSDDLVL